MKNGSVAQLDRASHYGCEGLGFESLQGHEEACKSLTFRLFLWVPPKLSPIHFALYVMLNYFGNSVKDGEVNDAVAPPRNAARQVPPYADSWASVRDAIEHRYRKEIE